MGSCFAGNDAKHSSKQWAAPHAGGFELVMDVRDVHGTANMQCIGANSRCLEPATAGPFLAVPSRIPGCPAEARCNVAVTCLACCGVRALLPCADATRAQCRRICIVLSRASDDVQEEFRVRV